MLSLTSLQHCNLSGAKLLGVTAAAAQVLQLLSQLQSLTHLGLAGFVAVQQSVAEPLGDLPAAACSSLTASSSLQHLDLSAVHLPDGAWQHVLRDGQLMPHLQTLRMTDARPGVPYSCLGRIISCCPALQELPVPFEVLVGMQDQLSSLARLTNLTKLDIRVHDPDSTLAVVISTLSKLTGLMDLQFGGCLLSTLGGSGLHVLTRLTSLCVWDTLDPDQVDDYETFTSRVSCC